MAFVDLVSDVFSNHDEDAIRRIECKWFYELPEHPDEIVEIRMKEILHQTISPEPGFRIDSIDVSKGETTTSNESLFSTILSFSVNMDSLSGKSKRAKSTFSLKIISEKGKGISKKITIIPGTVTIY